MRMKRERKNKSKKSKPTVAPAPQKIREEAAYGARADGEANYAGFSDRDLKKNLGCG
jgi:hypothetical protein